MKQVIMLTMVGGMMLGIAIGIGIIVKVLVSFL